MRQRRVKNLEERLAAAGRYLVSEPEKCKGRWNEVFGNENPIYLEIGCGKGQFISTCAAQNPERNYVGVEGQASVMLRALEKAMERDAADKLRTGENAGVRNNLRFMQGFINDMSLFFEDGELDTVYLNFSDPWPKERHAKRRLTHALRLHGYFKALKEGGCVEFKTDNDSLFEFTMEQIKQEGFEIIEYTRDLHSTTLPAKAVTTEYEDKFRTLGKNINYVKIRK